MAGDWIKMRHALTYDPAVVAIAGATQLDEFGVVGRLHAVWSWLDQHSEDGTNVRISSAFLDRLTACPGFADALRAVGWLTGRDQALTFPDYTEHNGETAKHRASEAKRKAAQRCRDATPDTERDKCPADVGTNVPQGAGPEKRREDRDDDDDGKRVRARGDPLEWSELVGWVGVTEADRASWRSAYPAVDIDRQLAAMHEWLRANPDKARKKRWRRFVTGWLARQQERGGDRPAVAANGAAPRARSWGTPVPMK